MGRAAEAYHHHQHHHPPDLPSAPAPCSLRTVPHAWLKGTWTLRDDSGRSHGHLMLLFPITMEEVGVYEEIYGASEEETSSSTVCSCPALCNVSFPLSFTEMLGYRWAYSCRVYRSKMVHRPVLFHFVNTSADMRDRVKQYPNFSSWYGSSLKKLKRCCISHDATWYCLLLNVSLEVPECCWNLHNKSTVTSFDEADAVLQLDNKITSLWLIDENEMSPESRQFQCFTFTNRDLRLS